MMVFIIFRPLYITLSIAYNKSIVAKIIYTMIDINVFGFDKCSFIIRSVVTHKIFETIPSFHVK